MKVREGGLLPSEGRVLWTDRAAGAKALRQENAW